MEQSPPIAVGLTVIPKPRTYGFVDVHGHVRHARTTMLVLRQDGTILPLDIRGHQVTGFISMSVNGDCEHPFDQCPGHPVSS